MYDVCLVLLYLVVECTGKFNFYFFKKRKETQRKALVFLNLNQESQIMNFNNYSLINSTSFVTLAVVTLTARRALPQIVGGGILIQDETRGGLIVAVIGSIIPPFLYLSLCPHPQSGLTQR